MPAFQAINIESEENIDEQVDTTKELHVDEALKQFQKALRLHAKGPTFREAAKTAYDELFQSDIFKYREARTDYDRAERQANGEADVSALDTISAGLDLDAGGADGVAASFSQALYISYKNYGQFFLDKLKDARMNDPDWEAKARIEYDDNAKKVLDNWARALDQDPSDPELWRKAARFGASINSGRIKRYCLEAAVELDDDPAVLEVEPPSVAEGLAGVQLKEHLQLLDDGMALSHPVMRPWLKKDIPPLLRTHLDPIAYLPDPTAESTILHSSASGRTTKEEQLDEETIDDAPVDSWERLAAELLKHVDDTKRAILACQRILQSAGQDAKKAEVVSGAAAESTDSLVTSDLVVETTSPSVPLKEEHQPKSTEIAKKPFETQQRDSNASVLSRKRSQSVAGLQEETGEDITTEKRSKRARRRTDMTSTEEVADPTTLIASRLLPFQESDQSLFSVAKRILESLGMEDEAIIDCIQETTNFCSMDEERPISFRRVSAQDLRSVLVSFSEETAMVLLNKKDQTTLSLSSFLEHTKSGSQDLPSSKPFDESHGLTDLARKVEQCSSWITVDDIAFEWVKHLSANYVGTKWSDALKTTVVQVLNKFDTAIYQHISNCLEVMAIDELNEFETMIPMLFELYIDIYERITNPSSAVDYATRVETKYRLERWLDLASAYVRLLERPVSDPLCARFLWASVMVSSLAENPVREHILLMWTSLRDLLLEQAVDTIVLPNNVVMPMISPAAADREISKLATMDFFLSLFQEEMKSPVQVIDTLEPVLNPSSVATKGQAEIEHDNVDDDSDKGGVCEDSHDGQSRELSDFANQGMHDLWTFLENSSTELRLFLWSRLGDAYEAIDYNTKRFSCYLKSIAMIIGDLESEKYSSMQSESRWLLFMRSLKSLDELLVDALSLALNDSNAFDIIDEQDIKLTAASLIKIVTLLHVVPLVEDEAHVGVTTIASSNSTFQSQLNKLREIQVRAWCLFYTVCKAGFNMSGPKLNPESDLVNLLAAIHLSIGIRKYCKTSNKVFLKIMRMELLKLNNIEHWEDHIGQVFYDLHGLKLGVGLWEVQDHGCPHEKLEKRQTMQLVPKIIILANRMPMRDLLKSDLKTTIDHMQQAIGQTKSTPQMIHNLRNLTELLKRPIHPLRLYQAMVGAIAMDAVTVNMPEAALAKEGWFFLLGMIALTKFKGVDLNRRQTPGATDDLRIGATFLRLQLQFTADKWDAWFRLAECFDYELDESVLWSAEKMNKDRAELVKFQRNAIHCYTLALSHSRHQDVDARDGDALHDLYHKFAMRLYSSSRQPFAMEPFQHSEQERFFIENEGSGTFKKILHEEMTEYKVWKFSAKLFRMAIERKPANWKNHYMLAKCYWKMYSTPQEKLDQKDQKARVSIELMLEALKESIHVAHRPRKSKNSDPILEPHYKIVSVLHKLVSAGDVAAKDAASILSAQPYGVAVNPDDHYASFAKPEDWEEYIIRNLTRLRDKDKSNWHHRIVMRHAKILFDESKSKEAPESFAEAKAAFGLLRDNMFTKTMVMNVWKCDAERPGRHHVFTEQYVRFMTKLLVILSDRLNMDLLLRRLRKKGADFYHFVDLWQSCCTAYLDLVREAHHIPPVTDDVFKTLTSEEFDIISERITDWTTGDGPHISALSCMKEAVELKKLNANLMKAAAIDDLISDCYSKIYVDIADSLPGLEPAKIIEERNQAKEVAARLEAASQGEPKPNNPLLGLLNPKDGHESVAGSATPMETEKSETAPRRKLVVRRPDILRKAEQAIVRLMEPPKSATAKSRKNSMSSGKRGSQTPNVNLSDADSDDEADPDAQVRREAGEGSDAEMHDIEEHEGLDSGDDSDLSDVPEGFDEEVPPGLLFSNFGRRTASADPSGEDGDSDGDGNEAETEGLEFHDGVPGRYGLEGQEGHGAQAMKDQMMIEGEGVEDEEIDEEEVEDEDGAEEFHDATGEHDGEGAEGADEDLVGEEDEEAEEETEVEDEGEDEEEEEEEEAEEDEDDGNEHEDAEMTGVETGIAHDIVEEEEDVEEGGDDMEEDEDDEEDEELRGNEVEEAAEEGSEEGGEEEQEEEDQEGDEAGDEDDEEEEEEDEDDEEEGEEEGEEEDDEDGDEAEEDNEPET